MPHAIPLHRVSGGLSPHWAACLDMRGKLGKDNANVSQETNTPGKNSLPVLPWLLRVVLPTEFKFVGYWRELHSSTERHFPSARMALGGFVRWLCHNSFRMLHLQPGLWEELTRRPPRPRSRKSMSQAHTHNLQNLRATQSAQLNQVCDLSFLTIGSKLVLRAVLSFNPRLVLH